MFFGDGTHSRGGPDYTHLTFIQKSKCGGVSLITRFHTNQRSLKMMSALPCLKKRIYDKKRGEEEEREGRFSSSKPLLPLRPVVRTH